MRPSEAEAEGTIRIGGASPFLIGLFFGIAIALLSSYAHFNGVDAVRVLREVSAKNRCDAQIKRDQRELQLLNYKLRSRSA